jgi:hypothetical protein
MWRETEVGTGTVTEAEADQTDMMAEADTETRRGAGGESGVMTKRQSERENPAESENARE